MSTITQVPEVTAVSGIVCTLKPTIDFKQDFFAVFGLVPDCDIDLVDLSARYRSLQQAVHPDRFMRECERSQRLAQQQASLVNEAYRTLKSPLARAQYLLELAGQSCAPEEITRDADFLMTQMDLRERLDMSAGDLSALDALYNDVSKTIHDSFGSFSLAWQTKDWQQAKRLVMKLQFANKLLSEIEDRQVRLLDA